MRYFPTLLGNAAFAIYRELDKKSKESFGAVIKAFTLAYSSPALVEAFRSELSVRNRKESENLAVYVGELRRLARRAYPKYVQCKDALDDVVLTRFGAGTGEIGRKARHKYPKTIEVALELASKLECRIATEKKESASVVLVGPEPPPAYVEEMRKQIADLQSCIASLSTTATGPRRTTNSNNRCYYCGSLDHFARVKNLDQEMVIGEGAQGVGRE